MSTPISLLNLRSRGDTAAFHPVAVDATRMGTRFKTAAPLILELAPASRDRFDVSRFKQQNKALCAALFQDLGVHFPLAQVRFNSEIECSQYVLRIFDARMPLDTLQADDQMVDMAHFAQLLRRHAPRFLTLHEVSALVATLARDYPDLVKETLDVVTLPKLADVLRRLAAEGVSIRNLRAVFASLADAGHRVEDVVLLTEHARIGLKRSLSRRYTDTNRALEALLLHPQLEDKIRRSICEADGGSHLKLDPDFVARILESLRTQRADRQRKSSQPLTLLTSLDVRRYVRRLIETEFFDVPVLSYHELAAEVTVRTVARLNA